MFSEFESPYAHRSATLRLLIEIVDSSHTFLMPCPLAVSMWEPRCQIAC